MAGRFSVEAVFKAIDKVTAPVSRMQNSVGKFTRNSEKNFRSLDKSVGKFTNKMKKGAAVIVASTAIIGASFINVAATGASFEQAITDVGAVSLKTRSEIAPLEQLAIKLGATTKFTATQSAQAMEVLARAGFSANDILATTPAVLSAAAASGLEIAEVADHVSNALKGMGLATSEAGMVADVLALASAKTNSTIGTLGESLRNVASTARQLKIPFNDTVAAVALLQDVGLDASVAGSALNTMLTKMAVPSEKIKRVMGRLGISFKDAKGNMLPFSKVVEQLSVASDRLGGDFDKVAFLAELVGLRGQKAAANLGELFKTGKLEKLTTELEGALGSAKKMADIKMGTTLGSFLLLQSAVDAVKVKIFNLNSGPLKDLIDNMTAWVSAHEDLIATKISDFIQLIVDNFESIVKWTKRVAKSIGIFIVLITVLKTLIAVMTLVNLVMALNPISLVVIGIGLLIAAVVSAIVWWDQLKEKFLSFSGPVQAALLLIMGPIGLMVAAGQLMISAWEPVKNFFVGLWDKITAAYDKIPKPLKALLSGVGGAPARFGASITNKLLGVNDDEQAPAPAPQMVTPQERISRSIEETRDTSTAEVTITDKTDRAEVTSGKMGPGLKLQHAGAF